jgi:type IV fimbrial biogenesis protein FimT
MKKQNGLTLIELLIYIAILGIITALSVSGFQSLISHKKSDAYLEQLKAFISVAQKIAIDRKQAVTICPSINQNGCDTSDWSMGLIMFLDMNSDRKIESNDALIEVMPGVTKGDVLSYRGFGSQSVIKFEPNGFFSSSNGTFRYCSLINGMPDVQGIYISRTGRVRDAVDDKGRTTLNDDKISSCQQLSN